MFLFQAVRDNPAFLQLRRIEISKEVAGMLARSHANKVYLDSNMLLLNQLGTVVDVNTPTAVPTAAASTATATAAAGAKKSWY